jgi:hypothetical protein
MGLDRRYSETRFYNGIRAGTTASDKGDRLVRAYLARARNENRAAQDYGGSTGGIRSAGGGMAVVTGRNVDIKDAREIFKTEGSGSFGARVNIAELKGFRQPRGGSSAVPPAG